MTCGLNYRSRSLRKKAILFESQQLCVIAAQQHAKEELLGNIKQGHTLTVILGDQTTLLDSNMLVKLWRKW